MEKPSRYLFNEDGTENDVLKDTTFEIVFGTPAAESAKEPVNLRVRENAITRAFLGHS
jgi:hypothetical protein